jgi:hypothetical protein
MGYCSFMVLRVMLPILEAATNGRVTPQRLWSLVVSKRRAVPDSGPLTTDVHSGRRFHDPSRRASHIFATDHALDELSDPQEIADRWRARGYWKWMRPDRQVGFRSSGAQG